MTQKWILGYWYLSVVRTTWPRIYMLQYEQEVAPWELVFRPLGNYAHGITT
jgi:hypothetical protein